MLNLASSNAAENAIRSIEEDFSNRLQSLPAHIAVIDPVGCIKLANATWQAFANDNGGQGRAYVGENYLDVCRASASCDVNADAALKGIVAVLGGNSQQFTMEYPCHSPSEDRWFRMEVATLDAKHRIGAIVSHVDITEAKRNEAALHATIKIIQASIYENKIVMHDYEYVNRKNNSQLYNEFISELYETVISAHYLAAQMLSLIKRNDCVVKGETDFLARLINRWATDVGTDLFNGKKFFDNESRF